MRLVSIASTHCALPEFYCIYCTGIGADISETCNFVTTELIRFVVREWFS